MERQKVRGRMTTAEIYTNWPYIQWMTTAEIYTNRAYILYGLISRSTKIMGGGRFTTPIVEWPRIILYQLIMSTV